MGASPEKLLSIQNSKLETVALAATQSINQRVLSEITWSDKEKKEHELVSNFIENELLSLNAGQPLIHGPETVSAGWVVVSAPSLPFRTSLFAVVVGGVSSIFPLELDHPDVVVQLLTVVDQLPAHHEGLRKTDAG